MFRKNEDIAVRSVPHVVVGKLVHVHFQLAPVLEDVSDERMYERTSESLPAESATVLYSILNLEVPHSLIPTNCFLI